MHEICSQATEVIVWFAASAWDGVEGFFKHLTDTDLGDIYVSILKDAVRSQVLGRQVDTGLLAVTLQTLKLVKRRWEVIKTTNQLSCKDMKRCDEDAHLSIFCHLEWQLSGP